MSSPTYNQAGFVYVLTNRAMPGIVKVGCTGRDPIIRARELSSTSAPAPFVVAWAARVSDFSAVERAAHRALAEWRISANREFFGCEVATARRAIEDAARPWLGYRLRLRAAAPRRTWGRRGKARVMGLPAFFLWVWSVGLVLTVLVALIRPAPAAWWPPCTVRAVMMVEHAPRGFGRPLPSN